MPRSSRLVVPAGTYHVLCRGNNRQTIFQSQDDRQTYLRLLGRYLRRYDLCLYHYALMSNHVHLIQYALREGALSRAMHGVNLTYAQYYRKKYGGIGHFWQDRFKSFLIEKESYLLECGRYVELNGVRAGLWLKPEDDEWTSYRFYALGRPSRILTENPLYRGMGMNTEERRKNYRSFVMAGLKERRGLARYFRQKICGSPEYQKTIMAPLSMKTTNIRSGRPCLDPAV